MKTNIIRIVRWSSVVLAIIFAAAYVKHFEGLSGVRFLYGTFAHQNDWDKVTLIAHAGGADEFEKPYSNKISTLDFNSDKYDLFELDFKKTSDGVWVCLHDWDVWFKVFYGAAPDAPLSLQDLQARSNEPLCTLDALVAWLEGNPTAKIVTDAKDGNDLLVPDLLSKYPSLVSKFIVQIYEPEEYALVDHKGFSGVIWTLYGTKLSAEEILTALPRMPILTGITMPLSLAYEGFALEVSGVGELPMYTHTVNSRIHASGLRALGISGFYTDTLG